MDDKVMAEIRAESTGENAGDLEYRNERSKVPTKRAAFYKVWNADPKVVYNDETGPKRTPGIVMVTNEGTKDNPKKVTEVVDKVRAVILFKSEARKLARGSGPNWRIACQSHDGCHPSLRIEQPLCRKTKAQDLAQIFSQWKGFDEAKVNAKVQEVTDGTGELQICGLKTKNGVLTLCPFAKKDPDTGQAGACKSYIYLHCWDIDRQREFKMELGGKNTYASEKFTSPIHEFFKFLRSSEHKDSEGNPKGLDCFSFVVEFSPKKTEANYYLDVTNIRPIEQSSNRQDMRERAQRVKQLYEQDSLWVSKEEYEKLKQANQPKLAQPVAAPQTPTVPTPAPVEDKPVSFDEDDIPF